MNLGASSLLTARYFRTFTEQSQDMPAQGIFADPYGGTRTGGQIDVTTQIGSKNLLKYGGIYQFVVPYGNRYDFTSYTAFTTPAFIITYPITHPLQPLPLPYTYSGLLPNNNPFAAAGLEKDFLSPTFCAQQQHHRLRLFELVLSRRACASRSRKTLRRSGSSNTARICKTRSRCRIAGRASWACGSDGYNFQIPSQVGAPASIPAVEHQRLYEPHLDQSYSPDPRDTIRIGFGHTLSMPLPSLLGADVSRAPYAPFEGIPSYDNSTGQPAQYCGPRANQRLRATTRTSSTG